MIRHLLAGLAAAALALNAHASLTPLTYNMVDGAPLHGAYYDNAYNGTSNAGYLSGGRGDLTDGVTTASVVMGYGAWAPYVLWDGISPVITFDFGSVHTLSSVLTYFKFYASAAVYMPGSMGLRMSDDGVNFGSTQLRTLSDAERTGSDNTDGVFELLSGPVSGRYLELTLNNGPQNRWLALGEVVFEGTPGGLAQQALPEPGTVSLAALALASLAGLRRKPQRGAEAAEALR